MNAQNNCCLKKVSPQTQIVLTKNITKCFCFHLKFIQKEMKRENFNVEITQAMRNIISLQEISTNS